MCSLVGGLGLAAEVLQEAPHRALGRCDEVDSLHGRHWLSLLLYRLHNWKQFNEIKLLSKLSGHIVLTCNTLRGELVHFGAGGHHLHGELVHNQDPPFQLPRLLVVGLHGGTDHVIQNTWTRETISYLFQHDWFLRFPTKVLSAAMVLVLLQFFLPHHTAADEGRQMRTVSILEFCASLYSSVCWHTVMISQAEI